MSLSKVIDRGCSVPCRCAPSQRCRAGQQRTASSPSAAATSAGVAAGAAVKVAFITKFPVAFFTAMEDAAKSYAAQNSGIEISYFSCKTPSDVACQTAQIEDAVARKFQAIVITPMGPEVIPAMTAAADKGLKVVLVDNDLDDFTKKTAVAATDNVKGGQAAGEYLKTVLKPGDTIGLMEGVRGVPALDARIQGVKDALDEHGRQGRHRRRGDQVRLREGRHRGRGPADPRAEPHRDLLRLRRPGDRSGQGRQGEGQAAAGHGLRRPPRRGEGDRGRRHDERRSRSSPGRWPPSACRPRSSAVQGKPVEPFIDTGTELVTTDNAAQFTTFQ